MAVGGWAWTEVGLVGKMSRNKTPLECGLECGSWKRMEADLRVSICALALAPLMLGCWGKAESGGGPLLVPMRIGHCWVGKPGKMSPTPSLLLPDREEKLEWPSRAPGIVSHGAPHAALFNTKALKIACYFILK